MQGRDSWRCTESVAWDVRHETKVLIKKSREESSSECVLVIKRSNLINGLDFDLIAAKARANEDFNHGFLHKLLFLKVFNLWVKNLRKWQFRIFDQILWNFLCVVFHRWFFFLHGEVRMALFRAQLRNPYLDMMIFQLPSIFWAALEYTPGFIFLNLK